jgi:hypothetical protein
MESASHEQVGEKRSIVGAHSNADCLLVRKDIDVNEHERLFNITLGYKLK